jgi:hypothetical protein
METRKPVSIDNDEERSFSANVRYVKFLNPPDFLKRPPRKARPKIASRKKRESRAKRPKS